MDTLRVLRIVGIGSGRSSFVERFVILSCIPEAGLIDPSLSMTTIKNTDFFEMIYAMCEELIPFLYNKASPKFRYSRVSFQYSIDNMQRQNPPMMF